MNPYEIKAAVESLPRVEKIVYIELYNKNNTTRLRDKAKELGITYRYLCDMIEKWKFDILNEYVPQYDFEIDTKDLSFPERLQLAINLINYKYEENFN